MSVGEDGRFVLDGLQHTGQESFDVPCLLNSQEGEPAVKFRDRHFSDESEEEIALDDFDGLG